MVSPRFNRKPVKGSKNWRYVVESGGVIDEVGSVILDFLKFGDRSVGRPARSELQ